MVRRRRRIHVRLRPGQTAIVRCRRRRRKRREFCDC